MNASRQYASRIYINGRPFMSLPVSCPSRLLQLQHRLYSSTSECNDSMKGDEEGIYAPGAAWRGRKLLKDVVYHPAPVVAANCSGCGVRIQQEHSSMVRKTSPRERQIVKMVLSDWLGMRGWQRQRLV